MDGSPRSHSRKSPSSRGSVFVEGALGSAMFFFTIIGLMDCMRLGFTWLTLEQAVGKGARYASLVEVVPDRSAEIRARVKTAAMMNIADSQIRICKVSSSTCSGSDPGEPGDIIEVRVTFPFQSVIGLFSTPLSVAAVVTNEPYEIQ